MPVHCIHNKEIFFFLKSPSGQGSTGVRIRTGIRKRELRAHILMYSTQAQRRESKLEIGVDVGVSLYSQSLTLEMWFPQQACTT